MGYGWQQDTLPISDRVGKESEDEREVRKAELLRMKFL